MNNIDVKDEKIDTIRNVIQNIKYCIIQTKAGWELRLDYNNLLAVCVDCHNKFQRRKVIK